MPEVRRLLLARAEPPERFAFRLAWSHWRRRHQAVAQRCHHARRARTPTPAGCAIPISVADAVPRTVEPTDVTACTAAGCAAELTDAQWAALVPLLPSRLPRPGRPLHDHRPIVAGLLWITHTGASWRQLPPKFGPWRTVYGRYRRWRAEGLWQRLVDVHQQHHRAASGSTTTIPAPPPVPP